MIKLTIDSSVLDALSKAFSKPQKSAKRALDKYVACLEGMLFDSLNKGRAEIDRKFGTYAISTSRLANRGGQIGAKKVRIHKWLEENNLALIQVVEKGSNLKGMLSRVKLTRLVTLDDTLLFHGADIGGDLADIGRGVEADASYDKELTYRLFPELVNPSFDELLATFDVFDVDKNSLRGYVQWLSDKANKLTKLQRETSLRHALTILRVANATKGKFPQKKKLSSFGRTYYSGINIQNVHKTLRRAILGDCCEYDIRSSVFAWKMGYARNCHAASKSKKDFEKEFQATLCILEAKRDFMATLRHFVFAHSELDALDMELQDKLLKQALTAMGFGARQTERGWQLADGTWSNPALVSILKRPIERSRFLRDQSVMKFAQEQAVLDKHIFELHLKNDPTLRKNKELQTLSGRLSKAKVLAYLYQHAETAVMDIVRGEIKRLKGDVLASIHDAIVVRKRLGADNKLDIEQKMREATGNPYWALGAKEVKRFSYVSPQVIEDEKAHKARIAEETARAQTYLKQKSKT